MNEFWNQAWLIFAGLLPFLGFLGVCYIIVRAIFNADRNERKAQREWEARQDRRSDNREPGVDTEPSGKRPDGLD